MVQLSLPLYAVKFLLSSTILGTAWEQPGNGLGIAWEQPGNSLGGRNGLGTAWEVGMAWDSLGGMAWEQSGR